MKKILFALFLFLPLLGYSQEIYYGISAGYITQHRLYVENTIEGTHIVGSQSDDASYNDGLRYAFNTEFKKKKFSVELEIAYSYNVGGNGGIYYVNNFNNPSNTNWAGDWAFGFSSLLGNVEFSPSLKYYPFKWLSLQGGLGVMTQKVIDPTDLQYSTSAPPPGLEDLYQRQNNITGFVKGIEGSFLPYVGTYKLGIGIQIKRVVHLAVFKERNLTAISKSLNYQDKDYAFYQNSSRYVVSVGCKLPHSIFKKKNKI